MENKQQYMPVRILDCMDIAMTEEAMFPVFDNGEEICPEQFFRTNEGWNIYYTNRPSTDIHLHMHNYVEILYFPDTNLEYLIESKIYRINAGDMLFIPRGFFHRPYSISGNAPYSRVVMSMSYEFLHGIRQADLDLEGSLQFIAQEQHFLLPEYSPENKFIRLIMSQLLQKANLPGAGTQFLIESFCAQIVLYMMHASQSAILPDGRATKNPLIRSALDYISKHICDEIMLESVASELFVSKYHLSHAFKKHMGISMHQYIIMKRIEMAKAMILENKPMNYVCMESGFKNYSNFFKAFKNIVGVSPSEYASSAEAR